MKSPEESISGIVPSLQKVKHSGLFSDELDVSEKLRNAKPPEELKLTVEELE